MKQTDHVVNVTTSQFEEIVDKNQLVFVDFWAEWCAPCKSFAHVYDKISKINPNIVFAKINIEQEADLAEMFQIRSIPHLMVFKEGIAIYSEAGSMPESTLTELVQQAVTADVSAIREAALKDE